VSEVTPRSPITPEPARPPLRRQTEGRYIAGVARGVAETLSVDVTYVRLAFVVLSFGSGVGVLLYLLMWAFVRPSDGRAPLVQAAADGADSGARHGLALGSIVLGIALLLKRSGLWFPDRLLWPSVMVATGAAMVWRNDRASAAKAGRVPWSPDVRDPKSVVRATTQLLAGSGRATLARIALGGLLVLSGFGAFVATSSSLTVLRQSLTAGLALALGFVLLAGPWLLRMGRDLSAERTARIRSDARAEMAEHLHDSVLQTLAIIQKQANQPREVITLARRQERELRAWLFGGTDTKAGESAAVLSEAIEAIAEVVEQDYHVQVDVVKVGDGKSDPRSHALMQAAREAMVNAAKHSGCERISVFLEVSSPGERNEQVIEVFVRDRGKGFDPALVSDDRRGLRDSVMARVERIGGTVTVHSEIGEGTEVHLSLARAAPGDEADPTPARSTAPTTPQTPRPL
jgi:signal transduction histidine kinase